MKTKKLFTSLAAAVMLSAGLAGTGMAMGQPVHAAGTTQSSNTKTGTVGVKHRTVSATVNSDNPKLVVVVAKDQTNTDQKIILRVKPLMFYGQLKLSKATRP